MSITVSCPACGSQFSLSDDLYRRRVAGSLVRVKCRHCRAEIAVDATETAVEPLAMPSHEASRKHPMPPRPKAITQIGLGTPPPPASLATTTPLPDDDFSRPALPLNATLTPLPVAKAETETAMSADPDSIWSDEETIAINLKTKPAVSRSAPIADDAQEMEQIEADEIPSSSSGAPTLDALTMEAGGAHVPHGRPPVDEFLVSFHASDENSAGAPTIDLTGIATSAENTPSASTIDVTRFASELDSASMAVASEKTDRELRPAAITRPLFELNAASAAPAAATNQREADPAALPPEERGAEFSRSEASTRERKYVIPPPESSPERVTPRKGGRSRAPMWIGLMVLAGAVGAAVGYRERMNDAHQASRSDVARPIPSPVVNTQAALPAEAAPTEATEAPTAAPTANATAEPAATADAPAARTITVGTTRQVAPNTAPTMKGSSAGSNATRLSNANAEPAVEKATFDEKPSETHRAPTAPDSEFDRDAARNALVSAAAQASSCRKEGDPSGTANLTITFAPSGRVTSAQIQGPPFSGTATGGCIASTMRRASVPAFAGDYVTVSKTIVIQ